MAVCVGCGLEVNGGILEVDTCDNGGILCATPEEPSPGGCTSGLYIQFPANQEGGSSIVPLGCGLSTDGSGNIQVNACEGGGILCGTAGGDTQCIYTFIQGDDGVAGQTDEACLPLSQVDTTGAGGEGSDAFAAPATGSPTHTGSANLSPSCNGLVRTCEGLWAPPKVPSINFNCGQYDSAPGLGANSPISNIIFPTGAIQPTVSGNASAIGDDGGGQILLFNTFQVDECLPIDAMSFTAFNITFFVNAGERWRFQLYERICTQPDGNTYCGNGQGFSAQADFFLDRVGQGGGYEAVVFNDISTWDFGADPAQPWARMEAVVTVNRLIGNGALNNELVGMNFQYRNWGTGYHKSPAQNCGSTNTDGVQFFN